MKIGRALVPGPDGPTPRVIVASADDGHGIDLRGVERLRLQRLGVGPVAAARIAAAVVPESMAAAIEAGPAFLEAAQRAAADTSGDAVVELAAAALMAPLDPPSFRDFMAFAEHFETAYELGGGQPPDVLYELPVSYLANHEAIIGPEAEMPWPSYSRRMDYELELGIVIGRPGRDLTPEAAAGHIFGYTILNDFSARDIQMREMEGRLGPSKGKHFASAVGPWIVTADALPGRLAMLARVNGETWSSAFSDSILWSIPELVAWASAGEPLVPGALLGTGTVGGGCGLELGRQLEPGDVVELEIEGIGVLRNTMGHPRETGWTPAARRPTGRHD
ncbi:MAG TPA: fumarylacetoacetate hydrolase family protein [Solirubrobacteraceae bacterium]|nr:fumarylacetoacetate hydrolase family protein [Solirubrobacteraceae bacterium]